MSGTGVNVNVEDRDGNVIVTFRSPGVSDLTAVFDCQAAHELSEKLAIAAHNARTGSGLILTAENVSDKLQRKAPMLYQRFEHMLRSMVVTFAPGWNEKRAAKNLVDQMGSKVV